MADKENWAYSEILKEHFMNPKNVLKSEDIESFDAKGIVGNVTCGDEMMIAINIDKERLTISDCKWKTYGCASAIASTSILSEIVKGMTLEEAYHVSPKDIAKKLGGLPEHKVHCSVLGDKALRAAIDDYYRRNGMKGRIKKETSRVICECMNVTDHEIEEAVLEGTRTFYELQEKTKISTVCGKCKDEANEILNGCIQKHFK
jgi:nitrogen fixation NifU-like protein